MTTILGIDPGTARVGWGVIEESGGLLRAKAYGCITTDHIHSLPQRLAQIYDAVKKLIKTHKPEYVSVEDLFFSKNVTTGIAVGQARGVVLLAAAQASIPVVSYAPNTVKKAICGSGSADKPQVQKMVTLILKLKETPKPDDTADALAIAATHGFSYKFKTLSSRT